MTSTNRSYFHAGAVLAGLSNSSNTTVVTTDVLIIGGGASGAHAAVRLTDLGQDVIVIEKQ